MSNNFVHEKHDIGVTSAAGACTYGLMLAKDKNGAPIYNTQTVRFIAGQYTTDPGYAALPVEEEVAIRQDDWHAGFGQEYYDEILPFRYSGSWGMDLRHEGMGVLGPAVTAIAKPTPPAATLSNTDFEATGSWTGGAKSTANKKSGLASWLVTTASAYQDAVTWPVDNSWRGHWFWVSCWIYASTYSCGRIGIDGGETPVKSSYHKGTPGWELLTVGMQLPATATRLRVLLYNDIYDTDEVYFDDLTLTNPAVGSVPAWTQFNGKLIMATGNILSKLNATGDGFTILGSFPAIITDLCPFTDGYLYIALGGTAESNLAAAITATATSMIVKTGDGAKFPATPFFSRIESEIVLVSTVTTDTLTIGRQALGTTGATHAINLGVADNAEYWYMDYKEAFTKSTKTLCVKYFNKYQATDSTCIASDTKNTVKTNTIPSNVAGVWSAALTVGNTDYAITDIVVDEDVPYICKEDRIFYLTTTPTVKVLAERTAVLATTGQGANSLSADHKIYYPCGTQSLLEYDSDTGALTWRDVPLYSTNIIAIAASDFTGKVQATACDDRYIFAALDNGAKIEIMASRTEDTGWGWHSLQELTLAGAASLYCSSIYRKRLWIGSTSSSDSIYWLPLTTIYGDITSDTNYTYLTGGFFYSPWHHFNFKGDNKTAIKITLFMKDTSSTVYYRAYYMKFGDTTWTEINSTSKFKTSPSTTAYIPADASGNKPTSTFFQFKIEGVTGSTSSTPKLLGYDVRAVLYPPKRRIIDIEVLATDDVLDIDRQPLGLSGENIETILTEAADATYPVTIYNLYGTAKTIKVLDMSSKFTKVEKDKNPERHFVLRLLEKTIA